MASLWNIKIHPLFLIIYVTTDLSTQSSFLNDHFYIITGRYKYIIFFFKFWETNSSTKKIYQAKIIIIFSIKEMFSIAFNLVLLNIFNSWKKFYLKISLKICILWYNMNSFFMAPLLLTFVYIFLSICESQS